MLNREIVRKRGADTNQNIFYLVVAVIVVAAAAFGFDQAIKSMNRAQAYRDLQSLTVNMMMLSATSPGVVRESDLIAADMAPASMVSPSGTELVAPFGGIMDIQMREANRPDSDIIMLLSWIGPSCQAERFCSSLTSFSGTWVRWTRGRWARIT